MGFQGHSIKCLRLKDNRVLLTYGTAMSLTGYAAPYPNAECTDFVPTAPEVVLRDDGGNILILVITWATQIKAISFGKSTISIHDMAPVILQGTI